MINTVINILILEDSPHDQELIKRQIKKSLPKAVLTISHDEKSFKEKIKWANPSIIISDYQLPAYTGLDALLYVKEHYPNVPFIFLSGTLSDDEAVASAILKGASGYLLKQNLSKLPKTIFDVYKAAEKAANALEDKMNGQQDTYLKLQKAEALLKKSIDFEGKDVILNEISEAMKGCKKYFD